MAEGEAVSQPRKKYHTELKIQVQLGTVQKEVLKHIPRTTLHRFRNSYYSNHIGIELSCLHGQRDAVEMLSRSKNLIRMLTACNRARKAVIAIKNALVQERISAGLFIKKKTVTTIERIKDILGVERSARLFEITRATFYSWANQLQAKCADSALGKCLRIWPNQVTKKEIDLIKELYPKYRAQGWSVTAMAQKALRDGVLSVSPGTWYKYVKLLGLHTPWKKFKKHERVGIRAARPNELWHADVTLFKTLDGTRAYIYFIVDNFSRYILKYFVSTELSGRICAENIKSAYETHILNKGLLPPDADISLMTDGGPENKNSEVDEYLLAVSIKQIIAQQDIEFSNSIIEAVNKSVKHRWLYHKQIQGIASLTQYTGEYVESYNNERPHYSLKLRTPHEVYHGIEIDHERIKNQIKEAKKARVLENARHRCELCPE